LASSASTWSSVKSALINDKIILLKFVPFFLTASIEAKCRGCLLVVSPAEQNEVWSLGQPQGQHNAEQLWQNGQGDQAQQPLAKTGTTGIQHQGTALDQSPEMILESTVQPEYNESD
jgi:hypothetical protein